MPAPTVVHSLEAQKDLRKLFAWIAGKSGRAQAREVLIRLDHKMSRLGARPFIGHRRREFRGEPYSFSAPPWVIVYEPLAKGDGVYILRILDGRQDIAALLGKKP